MVNFIPDNDSNELVKQQKAFDDWINKIFEQDFINDRCFIATFLFTKDIKRDDAKKSYHNYTLYLNRQLYGKAAKRFEKDKGLKNVAIIEGGDIIYKQCHYHTIFTKPYDRDITDEDFIHLIKNSWYKIPASMKNPYFSVDVKKVNRLEGMTSYITKFRTKIKFDGISYLDCFDEKSSYFFFS